MKKKKKDQIDKKIFEKKKTQDYSLLFSSFQYLKYFVNFQ